jgi:hypothetical protein
MNKYTVEENINFFEELYKSLDIEENELKTDEDNNKCLITNNILTDKYVELICGHKFNYIPLYHDLVNHKSKFNLMESSSSRLNLNEIRCPYCRNKEVRTLPYYEELGLKQINGVNFYDPNIKQNSFTNEKCCYLLQNNLFNPDNPESTHNKKHIKCNAYNTSKIIIYNNKNPSQPITYDDENYYCYNHLKIMIKEYKQKEQKEKEEKKQKEKEEKLQAKEAKELEKLHAKEAKAAKTKKITFPNENSENVIICNQINGCIQILKFGPNKGNTCGCKIFNPLENICKRHYLQNHKELK